ncbi:phasin family protein [Paraburkholderia guartelaensis]|uniref:phasin family protein n=1 Tax=Paraburkholderia guartelaensis TaxID=2546446 RepID=UPI002AB67001|nr:phasin family protein [Paraburkholderia guartelaensis]
MTKQTIALPDAGSGETPERAATHTAVNDFAQLCVETAGRIAELNGRALTTTLNEQHAIALESANGHSPFDTWRLNTSYALAGTAKAAAYWRHVNEILPGAIVDAVTGTESRLNRDFMAWSAAFEDTASSLSSTTLMGDPARAVQGVTQAVRNAGTDEKPVPWPGSPGSL